jgi:hypothetical protein
MFRDKNLTADQLRAKFLEISVGEAWFSADYHNQNNADETLIYDAGQANLKHIVGLFGPPPWEFLRPGDAPEHVMKTSRRQKKMTRNVGDSEYKAMRGSTVNYNALPKKPQFVVFTEPLDPQKIVHLWIPGIDPQMKDVDQEFFRALDTQIADGELVVNYKKPRKSESHHLEANQRVTLMIPRPDGDFEPFALFSIHTMLKAPRSATATLRGRIYPL